MKNLREYYADCWRSPAFQQVYRSERTPLYRRMQTIAAEVKAQTVLDIGCAYGQFVDLCNTAGMDAWGIDLPIDELKEKHRDLPRSRDHFIYGSVEDAATWEEVARTRHWDLITCMDTMRYLTAPEFLVRLRARHYLIKEGCDTRRARERRMKINANDVRLWSPCALADLFQGYRVERIYLPRFLCGINRPSRWVMKLINAVSPTYTALLRRVED